MPNIDLQPIKARFGIVGNAPQYDNALLRALQVAPYDIAVLINGESGSGKEHFPQIIHYKSPRHLQQYLSVNCGAFPEGTINSELFGHVKGAFTDASRDHQGYFERVDGGTLFLDEVAEMPLATQALLLRVLESGEYMRVGDSEVRKTNVRIVAATNKDLMKEVSEGRFREDLYYRLSTVKIDVPPLRDRGNDIWLLTRRFTTNFCDRYKIPPVTYSEESKRALLAYRWPGNVRQLKNVVEQIAIYNAGKTITPDIVDTFIPKTAGEIVVTGAGAPLYSYNHDREVIFKTILQMRHDIDEIQQQINTAKHLSDDSQFNSDIAQLRRETKALSSMMLPKNEFAAEKKPAYEPVEAEDEPQDIDTNYVDEPREPKTLEDTERETIIQALERNNNKRKRTAEELNISERTLYRKIKEYGLESRNSGKPEK